MTQQNTTRLAPLEDAPKETSGAAGGEIRVSLFARTDVGQIREHNEDNFLVADLTRKVRGVAEKSGSSAIGKYGSLFAVCDGMGGAAAGEIASQLAVDILYERMTDGLAETPPLSRDELARRLVRSIEAAGVRIFQEAKLDRTRRGMGTTVTAAALVDDHLFFAQVGDSRGYLMRGGDVVQLTRDQSLVNQLIEAGQLTEEEAETFEHNNIILQALGTADTVQVDLTYCKLRRGDTVLLCSDGLSGMVRFEEIREVLRTAHEPTEACRILTERANQAGGHDNITVIVARFDGEGLQPPGGDAEPPKYRKYPLPEELSETTESHRRASAFSSVPPSMHAIRGISSIPPRLPSTAARAAPAPASLAAPHGGDATDQAPDSGPQGDGSPVGEERIEIPGTHVPVWVVVLLVVGVIAVLTGTAVLLQ